jgi:hypothetical protein
MSVRAEREPGHAGVEGTSGTRRVAARGTTDSSGSEMERGCIVFP